MSNTRLNILFVHYAVIHKEGYGRSFMLAKEIAKLGHNVTFLTSQPSSQFHFPYLKVELNSVKVYAFPDIVPSPLRRTGFGFLAVILKCIFAIFNRFDIVHSDNGHRPSGGWPCRINRFLYNSKYITEWWDYFGRGGQYDDKRGIKKITHGYYDLFFEVRDKKSADGVIVLSEQMKKRAVNSGITESKIALIQGGADVADIKFYETNKTEKIKFGFPPDSIVFCFVGMNDGEFNDLIPFVKAINILKKDHKIIWFSTGKKLSEQIRTKNDIGNEFFEFGWVPYEKYSEILACADYFLLFQIDNICNQTRWPNKLGDYFAAGRKIIMNPVGDTANIRNKYPKAFLSCLNDTSAIFLLLEKLISVSPSISERKIIRTIAETEISWSNKAEQLIIFYQSILTK